jgi:hypothetical protein
MLLIINMIDLIIFFKNCNIVVVYNYLKNLIFKKLIFIYESLNKMIYYD